MTDFLDQLKKRMPKIIAEHGDKPQRMIGDNIRCGKSGKFSYTINEGVFHDFATGESGGIYDCLVYLKIAKNKEHAKKIARTLVYGQPKTTREFGHNVGIANPLA